MGSVYFLSFVLDTFYEVWKQPTKKFADIEDWRFHNGQRADHREACEHLKGALA